MNVLIIPEDFRFDQFILKPIIKAMMTELGKPHANVRVCRDPLLGGVEQAMKWERIAEILDMYGTIDLFLLIVDRDGKDGRRRGLDALEEQAAAELRSDRSFLAENAWQEVEVWLLAGHKLPKEWQWKEIREERDPKELYFEPYASQRGLLHKLGRGRKALGREAAKRYSRIRQLCPEVAGLEEKIREYISGS
jgi:hypothetical protein